MTKKFKLWQKILIVIGCIVGVFLIGVGGAAITTVNFRASYYKPVAESVQKDETRKTGALYANGRGIYDKDGKRVALNGISFGNYLVQEGWLSVNSLGVKYNADGSYAKINEDGIIEEYEETYQSEIDEALKNNENLTAEQIDELWQVYYDNFITEDDYRRVKEIGFNAIRLPMYYRNFLTGDDKLVLKENAFELLDRFLENCKKYSLYAVLDMHGVPGGQNGYEHSGTRTTEFWDNETYITEMCDLWRTIALRYSTERSDLYDTIACYDLINEPEDKNTNETETKQFAVQDRMYKAIREVDKEHMISIAGCWFFNKFPSPEKFGWENVMYQIHLYNWNESVISNDLYYFAMDLSHSLAAYNVPYMIGEFTFFNNEAEWSKWLDEYDERGWNWCVWTYKAVSVGWWDTSWGLYVNKLDLKNEQKKLDLRTATYDEILSVWQTVSTSQSYTNDGVLLRAMKAHFEEKEQ